MEMCLVQGGQLVHIGRREGRNLSTGAFLDPSVICVSKTQHSSIDMVSRWIQGLVTVVKDVVRELVGTTLLRGEALECVRGYRNFCRFTG